MNIHNAGDYEKLVFLRSVIQNTILSIQKYKQFELIESNDVNVGIMQLETLYTKTFQNIAMDVLRDDMLKIIQVFGTTNFQDFISIYFLKDKKHFEIIRNNKVFSLLCNHYHPIHYKEVSWTTTNHPTDIIKNKMVDDISQQHQSQDQLDMASRYDPVVHKKTEGKLILEKCKSTTDNDHFFGCLCFFFKGC